MCLLLKQHEFSLETKFLKFIVPPMTMKYLYYHSLNSTQLFSNIGFNGNISFALIAAKIVFAYSKFDDYIHIVKFFFSWLNVLNYKCAHDFLNIFNMLTKYCIQTPCRVLRILSVVILTMPEEQV